MRERAQEQGALSVFANTEVLGIDVEHGRVERDPHLARRHRDGDHRRLLRRLVAEDRAHGGRDDPADAGGAPDDRRRPGAALQGHEGDDRVPDRPRHGHEHVRAPGRERARDRLVRPPADPARPRGDPVERRGGAVADGVPVHGEGLPAADGGRARADPRRAERRVGRHQVRDQRHPLADARRPAAARRDAGGQGPLVGCRGLGEGRPGRRQGGRRVDDERRVRRSTSSRPTSRASTTASVEAAREGTRGRGVQQDLRDRASRPSSGSRTAACGCRRSTSASGSSARSSSRRQPGSGRSGTSRTRRCSRSTATGSTGARPSGSRAGGRRSSTPSTWRCATARRCST